MYALVLWIRREQSYLARHTSGHGRRREIPSVRLLRIYLLVPFVSSLHASTNSSRLNQLDEAFSFAKLVTHQIFAFALDVGRENSAMRAIGISPAPMFDERLSSWLLSTPGGLGRGFTQPDG